VTDTHIDRVAIVTGGSGGIGRAVCERLGTDGMTVIVHYAGSSARAEEAVSAITAAGGAATAFRADVADEDEVIALFDHAIATYGGVDVVVHTAGNQTLAPLSEMSLSDLDTMVRTNLRGTFIIDREAVRRLRTGGAIVNFSSSTVELALPNYSGYTATKGAVNAITLTLAKELRGRDITVNAVAPGPTATRLFLNGKNQQAIDRLAGMSPLERLGTPDDIAAVVAFLAGPGRWVNGQVLYVNGGVI
jgi:3-oxoacyl-[acyl-carrier protein] reductase